MLDTRSRTTTYFPFVEQMLRLHVKNWTSTADVRDGTRTLGPDGMV